MNSYRHTQVAWPTIILVLIVVAGGVMAVMAAPQADGVIPWLVLFGVLVLSLFCTLTVTVGGKRIECRFGVGLVRRRIALADVRGAEAVRNRWWYGWGIRLTPHGWLWNVAGLDAVELTFAGGKKFRIGTDEPEKLRAAIRAAAGSPDHLIPSSRP